MLSKKKKKRGVIFFFNSPRHNPAYTREKKPKNNRDTVGSFL